jgi:hypothetical protein
MRRTVCRAQHSQLARTASSNTRSTPEKRTVSAVAPCNTVLTVLRERRALDVLNRADAPCQLCARLLRDGDATRYYAPLRQVGAQVQLRPDEEHTRTGHRAADLGTPLRARSVRHTPRMACVRPHLVLGARDALGVREREAQDEDVCLRVRERAQAVVVVAAAGVAQIEAHAGALYFGLHGIAVEHCV